MAVYDLTISIPSEIFPGDVLNVPYSGREIQFSFPRGKFRLEAWGANDKWNYGAGGYSSGIVTLRNAALGFIVSGGQNGWYDSENPGTSATEPGGGASDIRLLQNSMFNRVIVAGASGGAGYLAMDSGPTYLFGYPGVGGGLSGGIGYGANGGGTQTSGGIGDYNGSFGGGAYQNGGGSGWYGGAGWEIERFETSSYGGPGWSRNAGGGGSGFTLTAESVSSTPTGYALDSRFYLESASTVDGTQTITEPDGTQRTGHQGNGYVRITVLEIYKLAEPENFSAVFQQESKTVLLSWDAVENAHTYQLFKNGSLLAEVSGISYTDSAVSYDTRYTYDITAKADGYDDSDPASASVLIGHKIPPPSNFRLRTIHETYAELTWSPVSLASKYQIYKNGVLDGEARQSTYPIYRVAVEPGNTYIFKAVSVPSPSTFYYSSDFSTPITVVNNPKLYPVSNLHVTDKAADGFTVAWSAVPNAARYGIKLDDGTYAQQTGLSKTFTGLSPDSTHTVSVIAVASGYYNSNASDITVYINPRLQTPSISELSQTQTSVSIAWSSVQNAASYLLRREGQIIYSGTGLSYNDTGLTPQSTHTYTVTAIAGTGYFDSLPGSLTVRVGKDLTQIDKQRDYLEMLRQPFTKLCRLRFLNPNGTTAFALDNNPKNPRSRAFIADGTISGNWQNGQRYTASVTLDNVDGEFDFSVNRLWFGQEIAIDEGLLLSNGEEYYRQSGVFIIDNPTDNVQPNGSTVTYNLVDKWANLDGTLGGNLEGTYEVPLGTNIYEPIESLLSEDRGNGRPIDGVTPVFTEFYNGKTQRVPGIEEYVPVTDSPYTLRVEGDGGTLAQVILGLAGMVNAWVGYDVTGALRVDPSQDDISDVNKPVSWRFSQNETQLLGMSYTVKKEDVYNDYIVVGEQLDDNSQPGGRAQNLDPASDTNIALIGRKTKRESASGYATVQQCKDLAEWRLKRSSVLQKAVSISCSQMFHIDLNSLVEIVRTDKPGSPVERHLVQGFSRPLASSGEMTISATSVNDFVTATVTEWPPAS